MVGITTDFYRLTFKLLTYSSKIRMKFNFIRRVNKGSSLFGAEHDMNIILNERLSHNLLFFGFIFSRQASPIFEVIRWASPIFDVLRPYRAYGGSLSELVIQRWTSPIFGILRPYRAWTSKALKGRNMLNVGYSHALLKPESTNYLVALLKSSSSFNVIRWPIGFPSRYVTTRKVIGPCGSRIGCVYFSV